MLGAGASLAGCASSDGDNNNNNSTTTTGSSSSGGYSFTDALGTQVTVNKPQRVVACMGSFAAIWELSGGSLVGVTDDAVQDYNIASSVTSVGEFNAPSLEAIIALDPDFVIMTASSSGQAGTTSQTSLKEGLESSGITVAYFQVTTFEDYLAMLETCTNITGRSDLYEKNGTAVLTAIDEIRASVGDGPRPTVLLMTTYSGGTRVQGSSTMTGAMLHDLKADNLADQNASLLRDFSLEAVIEANPDFIFVVPMGLDDAAALRNLEEATETNPAWAALDAVKNGRYIILDKKYFQYKPNERWAESYQILYDKLYG
jgi:iron complex transport system substrate-binding protein